MLTLEIAGQRLEAEEGATLGEVFKRSYPQGFKEGVAARLNGRVVDFHTPIRDSGSLEFISVDSPEGLAVLRHSTAHLMASAVMNIFPEAKFAIGPSIDDGFYYDFEVSRPISVEDLAAIEKRMLEIAREDHRFIRGELNRDEAIDRFKRLGEKFKVEIIEDLPDATVSTYTHSFFTD